MGIASPGDLAHVLLPPDDVVPRVVAVVRGEGSDSSELPPPLPIRPRRSGLKRCPRAVEIEANACLGTRA